jgi:hypothetical protein
MMLHWCDAMDVYCRDNLELILMVGPYWAG